MIKPQQTCQIHFRKRLLAYIQSYNTRSSTSGKFYVQSSRLEIQKNSFSRLRVNLWNKIPGYITYLPIKETSSQQIAI